MSLLEELKRVDNIGTKNEIREKVARFEVRELDKVSFLKNHVGQNYLNFYPDHFRKLGF